MPKTNGSGQARTLTPEQLDLLLEAAPSPAHRALWAVMRFSGSRVTESLRLRWGAIHDTQIVFIKKTTKTKTTREVRMGHRLQAELNIYRKIWTTRFGKEPNGRDLLFPGRFGLSEPATRQWADKNLRLTIQEIGLPSGCSLHTYRRSLATTMASSGVGLKTITRFTGHKTLQQLNAYIDISPADEYAALDTIS